jgi:hypothetical protein
MMEQLDSDFLVKSQTPVVCQAPYSSDIMRYRQKKFESSALLRSFCNFPYNENPTRALNTTSLKCCLPSTDAIDRQEKIHISYEGLKSPYASALH